MTEDIQQKLSKYDLSQPLQAEVSFSDSDDDSEATIEANVQEDEMTTLNNRFDSAGIRTSLEIEQKKKEDNIPVLGDNDTPSGKRSKEDNRLCPENRLVPVDKEKCIINATDTVSSMEYMSNYYRNNYYQDNRNKSTLREVDKYVENNVTETSLLTNTAEENGMKVQKRKRKGSLTLPNQCNKNRCNMQNKSSEVAVEQNPNNSLMVPFNGEQLRRVLLNSLSRNILFVAEAFYRNHIIQNDKTKSKETLKESNKKFSHVKRHYFNASYCVVDNIVLPLENNREFVQQFLNDTLQLNRRPELSYDIIERVFWSLIGWTKALKKQFSMLPSYTEISNTNHPQNAQNLQLAEYQSNNCEAVSDWPHQKFPTANTVPDSINVYPKPNIVTTHDKQYFSNMDTTFKPPSSTVFSAGPVGRQVNISIDPVVISQYMHVPQGFGLNNTKNDSNNDHSMPSGQLSKSFAHNNNMISNAALFRQQTTHPAPPTYLESITVQNNTPWQIPEPLNYHLNRNTNYMPLQEKRYIPFQNQTDSERTRPRYNGFGQQMSPAVPHPNFVLPAPVQPIPTELTFNYQHNSQQASHSFLDSRQNPTTVTPNNYSSLTNWYQGVPRDEQMQSVSVVPTTDYSLLRQKQQESTEVPPSSVTRMPPEYQCQQSYSTNHQNQIVRSVSTDSGFMSPHDLNESMDKSNENTESSAHCSPVIIHVTSLNPNASYSCDGPCCICRKTTNLKCAGCFNYYYCSSACQQIDWINHMEKCKKI